MEHRDYLVDIVNEQGEPVGQKRRADIDKLHDLYHAVYVLLVTPRGELVLSTIPEREDLPNLYINQLGATVAAIRRSDETADQAAVRALSRELYIEDATLHHLGDHLHIFSDERQTYISVYYVVSEAPRKYSRTDISGLTVISPHKFRKQLIDKPECFPPPLKSIWETYEEQLPI